jgi:hypothetical protein
MNKVQFEEMFPWDISRAMADTPIVYPPLGTLDWHGEHNAVGLDGFKPIIHSEHTMLTNPNTCNTGGKLRINTLVYCEVLTIHLMTLN